MPEDWQPTYLAMIALTGYEIQRDGDGWRAREVGTFPWHSARSIAFALIRAGEGSAEDPARFGRRAREWEKQILGAARP